MSSKIIINKDVVKDVLNHWWRIILQNAAVAMKDIITVILDFYPMYERLKFSKTLKSSDLILSENDTILTNADDGHKYAIVDIEPVKSGIHCWRIQVTTIIACI